MTCQVAPDEVRSEHLVNLLCPVLDVPGGIGFRLRLKAAGFMLRMHPSFFVLFGLAGSMTLFSGCSSAPPPLTPVELEERLDFCKKVIDAIQPDDKQCGPYISQVREMIKREEENLILQEQEQSARRSAEAKAAQEEASRAQVLNDYEQAKQAVLAILKDPSSAQFGPMEYANPDKACLTVNAKNSYGGYTGNQEASLIRRDGRWIALVITELPKAYCLK